MRAHQVSGGGKWPPPRRVSTACPPRGMRHWQRWGVTPAQYRPKGGHPAASLPAGEDRTGARKCRRAGSVVPMTHRNDGCDGGRAPTRRGRRPGEGADQARAPTRRGHARLGRTPGARRRADTHPGRSSPMGARASPMRSRPGGRVAPPSGVVQSSAGRGGPKKRRLAVERQREPRGRAASHRPDRAARWPRAPSGTGADVGRLNGHTTGA
jgi:hypothetical protein